MSSFFLIIWKLKKFESIQKERPEEFDRFESSLRVYSEENSGPNDRSENFAF